MNTTELPTSAYRITSHEILALLSFNSGEEIDLSRKVLGLAELPEDSDLVRAGVGTLNVRGPGELGVHHGDRVKLAPAGKIHRFDAEGLAL